MYRKVLLAYDGSQSGRTALLECADINNFLHADIHLLAVAPMMHRRLYLTEGFVPDTLQEEENRSLQGCPRRGSGRSCSRERGVQAEGHVVTGEPVRRDLPHGASELRVDLIVVGHRKHGFFMSRWWKGSVGASLIEDAPCSVLIAVLAK
jgi:nucleotide-binding universal stress UspA family protein